MNGSTRGQRGNARPDAAETNANGGKSIKTRGSRRPTSRGAGRVELGSLTNATTVITLVVSAGFVRVGDDFLLYVSGMLTTLTGLC